MLRVTIILLWHRMQREALEPVNTCCFWNTCLWFPGQAKLWNLLHAQLCESLKGYEGVKIQKTDGDGFRLALGTVHVCCWPEGSSLLPLELPERWQHPRAHHSSGKTAGDSSQELDIRLLQALFKWFALIKNLKKKKSLEICNAFELWLMKSLR